MKNKLISIILIILATVAISFAIFAAYAGF